MKDVRDEIAHGVWGAIDNPRDPSYVWVRQGDYVRFNTSIHQALRVGVQDTQWSDLKEAMFVYTRQDLEQTYSAFETLWWCIFDFNCYFRDREGVLGLKHLAYLEGRALFADALKP